MELNGEEVGVELTELFTDTTGNGSREREARQLHANFLDRLTTAYYAKGVSPFV